MNDPKRLLESGSLRLRALVEAGKRDTPGGHTEARVLGALGLGATGTALGAGAAHAVTRTTVGRLLSGLRHVAFSKVGVGLIAASMAGSGGYLAGRAQERAIGREAEIEHAVRGTPSPHVAQAADAPAMSQPSAPSSTLPLLAPSTPIVPVTDDAPPARTASDAPVAGPIVAADSGARPHAPAPARVSPIAPLGTVEQRPAESVAPSIAAQLDSIRRARGFVQAGDGRAALAELDAYEAQSPQGMFQEEEMALRVRALRLSGDAPGAARELSNLQARFPGSVHLAALAK